MRFGGVVMSKSLKEILCGTDSSDNIMSLFEGMYLEKVLVSEKNKRWKIYIRCSHSLADESIKKIESMIKSKFSIADNIMVIPIYDFKDDMKLEDIDKNYFEEITGFISEKVPFAGGWIKSSSRTVEGTNYIFTLNDSFGAEFLKSKGCIQIIEKYIEEKYNVKANVKINCRCQENSSTDYCNEKDIEDKKIISNLVSVHPIDLSPEKSEERKNPFIIGRKTDYETVPINTINETSGKITIEGDIFDVKVIETKTGRTIISFNITDYEGSITVKVFPKGNGDALKERISIGVHCRVKGEASLDRYAREVILLASDIEETAAPVRMDNAPEKRVELHLHTQMSAMDGMNSASDLVKRAAQWGHKAIAITDHGVVQAFPEAADAAKKYGIKVIYGVEAYLVDDGIPIVLNANDMPIDGEYVALDIETTGLSCINDSIIEIGAVKFSGSEVIDRFSQLVNPGISIPENIVELTGITDEMVNGKPGIDEVMPGLIKFLGNTAAVAHNAKFDMSFIKRDAKKLGCNINNPVVDTLTLSKLLFPALKKYKLDIVAKHLGISLQNHHRAVDDARCAGDILGKCIELIKEKGAATLSDMNRIFSGKLDIKKQNTYHTVILVKNHKGLMNLYKLISLSHLNYYYRRPRIPKSILEEYRDGLIIGSGCEAGMLFREVLKGTGDADLADLVRFYDYLEIQPLGNNEFLIRENTVENMEELKNINRRIVNLGKKYNRPVVATGDVHFLNPNDEVFRRILMYGQGFEDADKQAPLYFKTTDEMLDEFSYLGEEDALNVVVKNPNAIADQIEAIKPIPDETFPPKIDGAEDELREMAVNKAHEIYGVTLPEIVEKRLDRELSSIINHGYAVLYIIAQRLVSKSRSDGYLVGSRGSVGSSFVAAMCGITEVDPLPPHYVCPGCKYSEFITDREVSSGIDLPEKACPKCGITMNRNGNDIPFEVFLGFEGDKEPDIDLNFSGEYQPRAHKYTEELFGKGHVFRAGTIGTVAEKTAYGFVKNYVEDKKLNVTQAEIERLKIGCTGVKRTTGQHPGGVMVVPKDNEIYQFTPIQHPADDPNSEIITTHFDYHSISGRLLKLDILGHDDPTIIRMLQDLTGIEPTSIPLSDPEVMRLFTSPEPLKVTKEDINCEVGTLGLPEFGTKFVRQMLVDTQPKTFAELVRISGLSHGTDVWLNNAQDLIKQGTATLKDVISTRDDIMLYLIQKGVKPKSAFNIMERVRKGKGLTDEDIAQMKERGVPQWYIDSCRKIKYMFPKGHAVAYVMMAVRIAYFKVYYPLAYYATYFTVRADEFDAEIIVKGEKAIKDKIVEINNQGNDASQKDKGLLTILEIALEMYKRGFKFSHVDLYKSDAMKFLISAGDLLPPLNALQGLGETAAKNIVKARESGDFISIEDLQSRAKVSRTVIQILKDHGCLDGMPENNQLTLF